MTAPLLSVVVPCYNEEAVVDLMYQSLAKVVAPYKAQGVEILLIDDGSRDATWQRIEALCRSDPSVVGIKLSRNFGQQMAMACGFERARGRRVLVIDADLQDPPEVLGPMMAKMDEGYDVVYGRRQARLGETLFKRASAWLYCRVLDRLSDVVIPLDTGDFRLMNRKVIDVLNGMPERVRFTRGLVSWLGFRQTAVEYVRHTRAAGETHYPLQQLLLRATEGITSFSTRPLQMATWLGIAMIIVSSLLMIYVLLSWLLFHAVEGWTSLAAIFLFFQAAQWLMLGIIGNYLAIMFREIKGRPLYLVDTVVNGQE